MRRFNPLRPTDAIIGHVHVATKRVSDSLPFAVTWETVFVRDGVKRVTRPRVYKRGGHGVHYKVLKETFQPEPRDSGHKLGDIDV